MQQGSDVKQAIINNRSNKELRCLLFEATYNTPVVVEARARGESHPSTNANIGLLSYHKLVWVVFPNVLHWLTKHIFFARDAQSDSGGQCRCQSSQRNSPPFQQRIGFLAWTTPIAQNSSKISGEKERESDELSLSFSVQGVSRLKYLLWRHCNESYLSFQNCRNINHLLNTLQAISLFPPFNWGRSLTCPISVRNWSLCLHATLLLRHLQFHISVRSISETNWIQAWKLIKLMLTLHSIQWVSLSVGMALNALT